MEDFSLEDSKCLIKLQEYALQEIPGLTTEQKKTVCDQINRNALNNLLDPYLGEMRATSEIEIIKNKILNGFPDSSRLEVAMGVITMAMPMPNRVSKPITILASEVELEALIKVSEGTSAIVYKLGNEDVIKAFHFGEDEAKMMAQAINYLAEYVPAITPVTHVGGDRLLQPFIDGKAYHELPHELKQEALTLLRSSISTAYAKVHKLESIGLHAEIDSETHNFIFRLGHQEIKEMHWIDPITYVAEQPAR